MKITEGDIFWLEVTYPKTKETEIRPVLVYKINDNDSILITSFATITESKIESFKGKYDKWKSPIFKWKEAGLFEPSYVKANNIAYINVDNFMEKDYIGKMDRLDLEIAKKTIEDFIDSGEDPW